MICDFPDLFRLFVANSAKDVAGVPEYVALLQKNEKNNQFQLQRGILDRVRQDLDKVLDAQPTYKGQTRQAVILLEQHRGSADFEWYYDLITAAYSPKWQEAQREHFQRAARTLRKMVSDFPELIRLVAANPVKSINSVAAYTELCRQHENNRQFEEQRHTAERIKTALEGLLDGQPNYRRQIREALVKLEKNRGRPDFEWLYDMIVEAYKHRWSEPQQDYFDRVVRTVRSGNQYFLSFTNRPTDRERDKPVNTRYWYFIRSKIRAENVTKEDLSKRNFLAEAVYTLLWDESIHGFYYKIHEDRNRQVLADLMEGCATCRVFIQLVQNAMFEVPKEGDTNYCEFEYRKAYESIIDGDPDSEDRFVFVIAEDENAFIAADRVDDEYSAWHKHIMEKQRHFLPKVEKPDDPKITLIGDMIEKSILAQVRSSWDRLLDHIP